MIKYSIVCDTINGVYYIVFGKWMGNGGGFLVLKHGSLTPLEYTTIKNLPTVNLWFAEQNNIYLLNKRNSSTNQYVSALHVVDI